MSFSSITAGAHAETKNTHLNSESLKRSSLSTKGGRSETACLLNPSTWIGSINETNWSVIGFDPNQVYLTLQLFDDVQTAQSTQLGLMRFVPIVRFSAESLFKGKWSQKMHKHYCGEKVLTCKCCDGHCGPNNGCNCSSCTLQDVARHSS